VGRCQEARDVYGRQLAICREIRDRGAEARALRNRGQVLRRLDRADEGRATLEKALALFAELGDARRSASTLALLSRPDTL
jgi:tetratricopeptide (TPR) repeat protein